MITQQTDLEQSEYAVADLLRMSQATNYRRWLYSVFMPFLGRRVLEIGSGRGDLTEYIARGRKVFATDIGVAFLKKLSERFSGCDNVEVSPLNILQVDLSYWRQKSIDSVVSMQVLEHIADDNKALENIFNILPVGGRIITMVPALKHLYGTIDRKLGHHRRYSRKEITLKMTSSGFSIIDCFYFNMIGSIGWFINARLLRRAAQSSFQIAVFDKVVVPVMSRIEKVCKPIPFGQTLFCIGEKPAACA